ncbi:phage integrase family protein with SAM-like domain [Dysgonomonas alginatilytica]|uniref:Phage integrase family protein with SAM-like domain n=1 Tax=Dysgonomonas alginatilytica TaxID=1605892 RepID=A0A2V3PI16_9BACT|nr:phage integrase family protein with SAM-like domain [Dysgonomonas alginatilytica]
MKKVTNEVLQLAKYIHDWICVYVISIESNSPHTVRRYTVTMSLFVDFSEKEKGISPSYLVSECFSRKYIEEWILWLKNKRNCSGETCNVRLAAIRTFLKYLAGKNISYLSLYQSATLSARLYISRRTLQQWRSDGVIGYIKLAGKCLYRESEIEKLLNDNYHSSY